MTDPAPALKAAAHAALAVGRRRAALLDRMRRALLEGRDADALAIGRELTGISESAEGERQQ